MSRFYVCLLVSSLSPFCPLDLYSCDPPRVHRAVTSLLNQPQNNFKLFIRTTEYRDQPSQVGENVDGDNTDRSLLSSSTRVESIDLTDNDKLFTILQSLLPTSSDISPSNASLVLCSVLTRLICEIPTFRRIFTRLAYLQSKLDEIDIERLYPLVKRIHPNRFNEWKTNELWEGIGSGMKTKPNWVKQIGEFLSHTNFDSEDLDQLPVGPIHSPESSRFNQIKLPLDNLFPLNTSFYGHTGDGDIDDELESSEFSTPLCQHRFRLNQSNSSPSSATLTVLRDATFGTTSNTSTMAGCVRSLSSDSPSSDSVCSSCSSSSVSSHSSTLCSCMETFTALRYFLLSTTLKDVSIMTTLQAGSVSRQIETPTDDRRAHSATKSQSPSNPFLHLHYSVRMIDIEMKSIEKLPEYYRLDQEIVTNYIQQINPCGVR